MKLPILNANRLMKNIFNITFRSHLNNGNYFFIFLFLKNISVSQTTFYIKSGLNKI